MANTVSKGVFGKSQGNQKVYVCDADITLVAENFATYPVIVTNTGASGTVIVSLPSAVVGMELYALVNAAQVLSIDPNGTETIATPSSGAQGSAGVAIGADAVGEWAHWVCIEAGKWSIAGYAGTWS